MKKKIVRYLIIFVIIPAVILGGMFLFSSKAYGFISLMISVLSCVPFFMSFEKRRSSVNEITVLAVMIVFSIIGRTIFAPVPFFKPVTAIVVITGIYMGGEAGFLCGSLSAVLSNFIFGQGIWTPFQMFSWGIVGLFAGILGRFLKITDEGKNSKNGFLPSVKMLIFIVIYGIISGVLYSAILDISTVLFMDGKFNLSRYYTYILGALPITVVYSVSNIIFLLLLAEPVGKKLKRIKMKYGI